MPRRFVPLADTVSQETGIPIQQILLLRHSSENIRGLLRLGGTVEEYTALQPVDSKYDFLHATKGRTRAVVVIVHDYVYEVYEVTGVEAEGSAYSLASAAHHEFDLARDRPDRHVRRFRLVPLLSRVVGQPIRGWEGSRTRTPVQRSDGAFFEEIEVDLPVHVERDAAEQVRADLEQIESEVDEPETTRTALSQARLGQGRFRRDLLALWGGACAVTGCDVVEALRASHCKPWRDASNAERLNPANGLLLVATLDALFDAGLIAFSDGGEMLLDASLTSERQSMLGFEAAPIRMALSTAQRAFLRYHRENIFRRAREA